MTEAGSPLNPIFSRFVGLIAPVEARHLVNAQRPNMVGDAFILADNGSKKRGSSLRRTASPRLAWDLAGIPYRDGRTALDPSGGQDI